MPLDLSEAESVNSELNEFKAKVESVAKRYATEHNWCSVVDRALEEIGIEPVTVNAEIEVQVTVKMPVSLTMINDLIGKTPEEQNAIIAQKLFEDRLILVPSVQDHGLRYLSTHDVIGSDQIEVLDVNQVETHRMTITGVPMGYSPVFTSDDGRVRHFVSTQGLNESRYTTYALCGAAAFRWARQSSRDEGRNCARCRQRAANL